MKRFLFIGVISGMMLTPGLTNGEIVDRIVAVVNDKVITLRQLQLAENSFLQNRPGSSASSVDPSKLLEELIEEKLLTQMADKAGITVTQDELNVALEEIKKRNKILTDTRLKEVITSEGQTWDQFLEEIRKQIKMVKLVNREVRSRVTIDEAEVRDFYEKNKGSSQEKVRARHILFSIPENADDQAVETVRKKAEALLSQIKEGLDFAEAARQYSEDPSREQGGDLGVISKGQMIAPLDEVIFNLKPGEVSQPIRSNLGFHLVKVEERIGGEAPASEDVKEQIRNLLFQKKAASLYKEWITKLKSEAYIEIKDLSPSPEAETPK